ncbi:MAG: YceI family protein [Bacteroidota bacterium]
MKKNTAIYTMAFLFFICFSTQLFSQNYTLDQGHTYFGFSVERFLVGEVVGRFDTFEASFSIQGDDLTALQFKCAIDVNSINSNNATRDGHLKGALWLDAENYPEIHFVTSKIEKKENVYTIKGEFTIKGVTKTVEFPATLLGPFKDPTQKTAIGIQAEFPINRFDYGISFNKKMDNGSFFIGDTVDITIRALAYQE